VHLRPIAALSLAVLLLLVPISLSAQSQLLTGRVVDPDGRPIAGAMVELTGAAARSVETDRSGGFRIEGLPSGRYQIQARQFGYLSTMQEVMVGGEADPVALVLDAAPLALEPLRVVTTVRGGRAPITLPVKIDVIESEAVQTQQALVSNPTEMLSNLIPSFSPGRQKLSTAGESFRGRRPLFLIDGVPQSNPLRDGRRDGFTIGMDVVERVEVVFGANATQGLGATGGLVNYITVSPPGSGRFEQRLSLSTTTNDGFEGDATGVRAHWSGGKDFGAVDALVSFGWESRGLQYDGSGRPIAIDNVQGDVADSRARNLFVKLGWEPDADRRIQLSVSDFRLAQEGGFVSVAGDRAAGIPATSIEGDPRGTEPVNDVTTASLELEDRDFLGGALSLQGYLQDFSALYGGGVFGIFQDPSIAPQGELFDQSENNSEKLGLRLTWDGRPLEGLPIDLVTGVDLLRDRTFQSLAQTNRNWVPETTFRNWAPFAQADLDLGERVTLTTGLRWEFASLDVPTFTSIAGNRSDFQTVEVQGGAPDFNQALFNVGAVVRPVEGLRLYGTFAQAYSMPDVGRVLRGASQPGTAVESFLALEPVETDNVEFGAVHSTERTRFGLTVFRSQSDFGTRLVPNADGIFQVFREPVRTRGIELTGRFDPTRALSLQAAFSALEGRFDGDDDGEFEADLGAGDIGPDRLNVSAEWRGAGPLSGRLQAFRYFDRDFEDGTGAVAARFEGYTTLDASVSADLRAGISLSLGIANLLDQQYVTYFGQAASSRDDQYFAGRGRTLTLRIDTRF